MGWAQQEFETIDLGDPRLNRRAVLLAETAAAYRFLRNEQVSCEDVMTAHLQATMGGIREYAVVLCLQDTTELDYNGQAMTGLGPLSYEAQRGLLLHPTYVVTPEREPLGVMNDWTWARELKQGDAPRGGVLESVRWVESHERIAEQAGEFPGTRHVCIGDRESDILALLVMTRKMNHAADYLVRLTSTTGCCPKEASCGMRSWPARRWGTSALRCRPVAGARPAQSSRRCAPSAWRCLTVRADSLK